MKSLMRTLTLSAAALAALMSIAPKADAQDRSHGQGRESRPSRGDTFRGGESRGGEFRGRESRGGELRGREFRGGEFRGRAFVRPPAFFSGRRSIAPFRVFAGSRFFSYCPGPGYIYIDDLGWVFPPFFGAVWAPRFDRFGLRIGGFWR
ncbi:MAG TPA: hypothetical protein VFZ57_11355 [Thermoanaerobaculia bacterium]|nr:hypothetical protein [Thermoanaerobaculia bacterium]